MMDDMYLKDIINRIGKEIFVKYYYDFKKGDNQWVIDKMEVEPFTNKSKISRASKGIRVFRENLQLEALESIINSKKLKLDLIEKAKEIYEREK